MTGLAQDETLPDVTINKGVATIKVKLLGYKPEMKKEFKYTAGRFCCVLCCVL